MRQMPGAHRQRRGVPVGVGQFAGRTDPQAPDVAAASELVDVAMRGDGGLRVALTTASNRHFTGSDLSPQTFLAPPAHPNSPESLATSIGSGSANYRRAVNRHRGRFPIT